MSRTTRLIALLLSTTALTACGGAAGAPDATPGAAAGSLQSAQPSRYGGAARADFNRTAAELYLPLFWAEDPNGNNAIDPAELAVLWGQADTSRDAWVADGKFTEAFAAAHAAVAERLKKGVDDSKLEAKEQARRKLIREELAQGRPTLVRNSFVGKSAEDRAIVEAVLAAAELIEIIHAKQIGSHALAAQLAADDAASHAAFHRNQGPWCFAPHTEKNEQCGALASYPKKISGLYPADIQKDDKFCDALGKRKDAKELRHQFVAVRGEGDNLKAAAYTDVYATEMQAISGHLKAAAEAIQDPKEAAFKKYLLAAAQSFSDNNWEPADEAWAAMNVHNSKWYLRIGPDEVYFEPCNMKAGFHVSFALINQASLAWQNKLDPVKGDMEGALAKLAGAPYKRRDVSFHLPDFIDIVLNAGDSRSPHGATIGQSLPNWGPVAKEGRGRTVAMTNLYTDPDSRSELTKQAASLLCADTMKSFDSASEHQVLGTVLHEAAHNLGPTGEYEVGGKKARVIFGGPMASTMEELKAQTAALYFTDWLVDKKLITREQGDKAHVRDITWAFGHISRGMYTANDKPRPYSQLAAIQVGALMDAGAMQWRAAEKAANGQDQGCMALLLDKFPAAVDKLMRDVAVIKAKGDKKGAERLKKQYVDVDGDKKKVQELIRERWLRAPKASFVYAIEM